ncbi:MAG: hypothetical protein BWY67_01571 [Bacteroidetes bacterium ADurb.Bin397]|nr:MAG: hypothetical protein BWY67_01571 [Bacteroidetes bacterium ADurb.Bin397]
MLSSNTINTLLKPLIVFWLSIFFVNDVFIVKLTFVTRPDLFIILIRYQAISVPDEFWNQISKGKNTTNSLKKEFEILFKINNIQIRKFTSSLTCDYHGAIL